jgi:triacylglycerol lipase
MSRPVLLVHGILESGRRFGRMADALRRDGRDVHVVAYTPNDGSIGIDHLAQQLADYVHKHLSPGQPFDLVGNSMGGLVCRYYIQRLGGADRARRLVTLASPHRGTLLAYFLGYPAIRQMRPGSDFLAALNADDSWTARVPWTSIWTPLDLVILPANRSRIRPAANRRVWVLLHPWVVSSRRVVRLVREILRAPAPVQIANGEMGAHDGGRTDRDPTTGVRP